MIKTKNIVLAPQIYTSAEIKENRFFYVTPNNFRPLLFNTRSLPLRTLFKLQCSLESSLNPGLPQISIEREFHKQSRKQSPLCVTKIVQGHAFALYSVKSQQNRLGQANKCCLLKSCDCECPFQKPPLIGRSFLLKHKLLY